MDRRSIVANYGRSVRISGTLRSEHRRADRRRANRLDAQLAVPQTRARIARVVHTDADGRFSISTRATANRTWTLINQDTGARLTGKLKVRSRISLRAARKRVSSFGKMRPDRPHPERTRATRRERRDQSQERSRWRTVAVVRSQPATGRFKFSYRFTRISHARLRFRAVALKSSDLTVVADAVDELDDPRGLRRQPRASRGAARCRPTGR